jgi:hypothetical protein
MVNEAHVPKRQRDMPLRALLSRMRHVAVAATP